MLLSVIIVIIIIIQYQTLYNQSNSPDQNQETSKTRRVTGSLGPGLPTFGVDPLPQEKKKVLVESLQNRKGLAHLLSAALTLCHSPQLCGNRLTIC